MPRGYKTFFVLSSTKHDILTAHKKLILENIDYYLTLKLSDVVNILLINYEQNKFMLS